MGLLHCSSATCDAMVRVTRVLEPQRHEIETRVGRYGERGSRGDFGNHATAAPGAHPGGFLTGTGCAGDGFELVFRPWAHAARFLLPNVELASVHPLTTHNAARVSDVAGGRSSSQSEVRREPAPSFAPLTAALQRQAVARRARIGATPRRGKYQRLAPFERELCGSSLDQRALKSQDLRAVQAPTQRRLVP